MGALPFAIILGKVFYNTDVRQHGSGNPGATNVLRTLGTRAGLMVLLLDMAKGFLPVLLARYSLRINSLSIKESMVIAATLAILGHVFSPFLSFKGGKGVATTIGALLALEPLFALAVIAVFIVVLLISRYVSLSSILAAFTFTLLVLLFRYESAIYTLFGIGLTLLIVLKHRANIQRLIRGEENRFAFPKK